MVCHPSFCVIFDFFHQYLVSTGLLTPLVGNSPRVIKIKILISKWELIKLKSKGNHKQNEKNILSMGENICKGSNWQGINLKNIDKGRDWGGDLSNCQWRGIESFIQNTTKKTLMKHYIREIETNLGMKDWWTLGRSNKYRGHFFKKNRPK